MNEIYKVKPQDYQALPVKIEKLLSLSQDQKNKVLQDARLEIERNFSKTNMVMQYLKLYESV